VSSLRNGLWSALQTHLQGIDGTTLPVEPEIEIVHVTIGRMLFTTSATIRQGRRRKSNPAAKKEGRQKTGLEKRTLP
jgi:hypothetical protein